MKDDDRPNVCINDLERAALGAVFEPAPGQKSNTMPLVQILRDDRPLSRSFRLVLAELIDPESNMVDVKLVPKNMGDRRRRAEEKCAKNEVIVKAMVFELRAGATVEAAAAAVSDKLGISDRWVMAKWQEAKSNSPWSPWLYGRRDPLVEKKKIMRHSLAILYALLNVFNRRGNSRNP